MIKGSIQEEDIRIINIYAPNIGAPQCIRQLLTAIKEEIDTNTIIVGDLNTSLTPMDRSSKQKINKETQEKKRIYKNKPKTIKKMVIGTYISIITINVNGLNAPTKRHRLVEWIQKQDPYICCLQETHFRPRDTYRLKVRGWKKIFHANGN